MSCHYSCQVCRYSWFMPSPTKPGYDLSYFSWDRKDQNDCTSHRLKQYYFLKAQYLPSSMTLHPESVMTHSHYCSTEAKYALIFWHRFEALNDSIVTITRVANIQVQKYHPKTPHPDLRRPSIDNTFLVAQFPSQVSFYFVHTPIRFVVHWMIIHDSRYEWLQTAPPVQWKSRWERWTSKKCRNCTGVSNDSKIIRRMCLITLDWWSKKIRNNV